MVKKEDLVPKPSCSATREASHSPDIILDLIKDKAKDCCHYSKGFNVNAENGNLCTSGGSNIPDKHSNYRGIDLKVKCEMLELRESLQKKSEQVSQKDELAFGSQVSEDMPECKIPDNLQTENEQEVEGRDSDCADEKIEETVGNVGKLEKKQDNFAVQPAEVNRGEISVPGNVLEEEVKDTSTPVYPARRICRYFRKGFCALGNDCTFLHVMENKRAYSSTFPPEQVYPSPMEGYINDRACSSTFAPEQVYPSPMGRLPYPEMRYWPHMENSFGPRSYGSTFHPYDMPTVPMGQFPPKFSREPAWGWQPMEFMETFKKKEEVADFEESLLSSSTDETDTSAEYDKNRIACRRHREKEVRHSYRETKERLLSGHFDLFSMLFKQSSPRKGQRYEKSPEKARLSVLSDKPKKHIHCKEWCGSDLISDKGTRTHDDEWGDGHLGSKYRKASRSRPTSRSRRSHFSSYSNETSSRSLKPSSCFTKLTSPLTNIALRAVSPQRKHLSPRSQKASYRRSHSSDRATPRKSRFSNSWSECETQSPSPSRRRSVGSISPDEDDCAEVYRKKKMNKHRRSESRAACEDEVNRDRESNKHRRYYKNSPKRLKSNEQPEMQMTHPLSDEWREILRKLQMSAVHPRSPSRRSPKLLKNHEPPETQISRTPSGEWRHIWKKPQPTVQSRRRSSSSVLSYSHGGCHRSSVSKELANNRKTTLSTDRLTSYDLPYIRRRRPTRSLSSNSSRSRPSHSTSYNRSSYTDSRLQSRLPSEYVACSGTPNVSSPYDEGSGDYHRVNRELKRRQRTKGSDLFDRIRSKRMQSVKPRDERGTSWCKYKHKNPTKRRSRSKAGNSCSCLSSCSGSRSSRSSTPKKSPHPKRRPSPRSTNASYCRSRSASRRRSYCSRSRSKPKLRSPLQR